MLCRVFYILGSIFHCIAVSAVFQHFYIISPVSEGRAFLRRNAPSFRKPPDTGRFMAAWHDQINRTMSAGCRFDLAIQSSAEQIAVKTGFFFRNSRRKFQDLILYFFQILYPLQPMVINSCQLKKFPAHGSALTIRAFRSAQNILYFRICQNVQTCRLCQRLPALFYDPYHPLPCMTNPAASGYLPSSQKATALAAATFKESTPWDMGILMV